MILITGEVDSVPKGSGWITVGTNSFRTWQITFRQRIWHLNNTAIFFLSGWQSVLFQIDSIQIDKKNTAIKVN